MKDHIINPSPTQCKIKWFTVDRWSDLMISLSLAYITLFFLYSSAWCHITLGQRDNEREHLIIVFLPSRLSQFLLHKCLLFCLSNPQSTPNALRLDVSLLFKTSLINFVETEGKHEPSRPTNHLASNFVC